MTSNPVPFIKNHKDGSLWARGQMLDGRMTGYWEWFRKDGTKLRSGWFEDGDQCGEWTTYDKAGMPYKTTLIQPCAKGRLIFPNVYCI